MARKKRKTSKKRKVVSSPWKIGLILISIWLLYFFINFYAPNSPLIYLDYLTDFFFWKLWSNFFYWLLIFLWIVLILYPANWKERIFTYSFISFIFLLIILSFPLLNSASSDNIFATGWYIWYGWIKLISIILWNSISATKTLSIALFWISTIFTAWKLNLFLLIPQIEFEIPEKKEIKRKKIKVKVSEINKLQKNEELTNKESIINKKENLIKNIFKDKIKKKIEETTKTEKIKISYPKDKPTFPVNNLEQWDSTISIDENILIQQAWEIQNKLNEFNIPVEVVWYEVWPSVIQFKLKLAKWIKVSSIENLKKDLSLSLKSAIRILAPIPWTEFVWIEMPNPKSKIVYLSEILKSKEFSNSMNKSFTNLSIWKAIDWSLFLEPLEKMPHLLVAWQTWSGKSVAINDYIISLLYQNTPDELKLIMVDPKQVELWLYDGLPHLLAPIINEPDKALKALKWAVDVMNRRYKLLKDKKVRNIYEYNEKVDEKDKMSRIVIIVDELADLMMSWNKKDVEHNIARIAQMARAVWMHLILATQRPSVNVITGLIKANIPTRIAFWVVSSIDSRTILDRSGAEDLLWRWDLLFVSPNYKHPIRVQAPLVSTEDTENIISTLKEKYLKWIENEEDIYDKELIDILEWNQPDSNYTWWWNGDDDELIKQSIEIIQQTHKASITLLQRRLKVWFARAARLMDQLEEKWIVWPQEGSKPREILI